MNSPETKTLVPEHALYRTFTGRKSFAVLLDQYTIRRVRLACGWVLFSYLTLHFLNHSLGNISLQAMMWGTQVHEWIWRGPVGGPALYGAFAIHFSLGLWALYQRRSFRMGWGEGARLILGFSIVPLLAHHYFTQRWAYSTHDIYRRYDSLIYNYFLLIPFNGERQVLVLLVAWTHGCLGMHYWLRHRPGYRKVAPLLSAFAVLLPVTALLGVAQAVREISVLAQDPAWAAGAAARGHFKDIAVNRQSASLEQMTYWVYAAMVALVFVARGARWLLERRRGTVRITYPSGMVVRVPRGLAVLDASRRASIPHASICGGRGRCSTCRVRVLRGIDGLPAPWPHEAAVLARFGSSRNVRLACQTRPVKDITILPLLPPDVSPDDLRRRTAGTASAERFVAIMFIDIRESTALVETRLPYDVIFLLNHFFEAVGGAVAVYGGSPNQFLGDGMMAIFGMECEPMEACRQVLAATSMIYRKLEEMNHLLADDLPRPIRIGIGVHAGTVILGEIGYRERFLLTAIGDPVHVAARLQELSKEYRCQMVVSEVVRATADLPHAGIAHYGVRVRGRELPLDVWAIDDATQFSMISP